MTRSSMVLNQASVFFDDASGNRQAEASAGVFGGKERIEQPFLDFGSHSSAVIRDLKNHNFHFATAH